MQSPVDNLRRYATPVVTAGAAGSPPVARFEEGGDVEGGDGDSRMRNYWLGLLAARQAQSQPPPRPQAGAPPRPAPALPVPQAPEGAPQVGKPPAEGNLMGRLRESLSESAVPSQGENFRQQLMALGAGLAGSQSRSFAGAMAEGVRGVQQQEQQQQQNQRQLLETEATARYREATIELQRAEQAWNRDPNNPHNIERLAHARAMLMQAAAAGSRSGQERLGTGIPGEGGVYYPAVGRFVEYPQGFRPYAQVAGEESRADRRDAAQQRADAATTAAEARYMQLYEMARTNARHRLTPVQQLDPERYITPRMNDWVRRFQPPPGLRGAFADVLEPPAPEARTGNVPTIRMAD